MSAGKGDLQDHGLLLCSLFLGFYLDAYVTIGTDKNNAAIVWVTTIQSDGSVLLWDPVTGLSYSQSASKLPFRSVGCCFSATAFYANVQVVDDAAYCKFDFSDETLWKSMSADALATCKRRKRIMPGMDSWDFPFRSNPCPHDILISESDILGAIKQRVVAYRKDHGML